MIAIQPDEGSYSERWIEYCNLYHHKYKLVDVYRNDIILQLQGCSHFLWNFRLGRIKDVLFAKQLLYSVENMEIKVFPNFFTIWHYDDKIGQKYLLESIKAPLVKTEVFYNNELAIKWANTTTYPVVFKLRGGASSINVKLIKSKSEALKIIKKAFSTGFDGKPHSFRMKENWAKFKRDKTVDYLKGTIAGLKNYLFPTKQQILDNSIEKGYVYIQEFLPNNDSDIRIFIIGDRAFGGKRFVRENDFRASGSGLGTFSKKQLDERCVKIAFEVSRKLSLQSVAFDFIFDKKNDPKIIEFSYASASAVYDDCEGYWDSDIKWYPEKFKAEYWMIEDLINKE